MRRCDLQSHTVLECIDHVRQDVAPTAVEKFSISSQTHYGYMTQAQNVTISEDTLMVDLADGRTITVPLLWYPRLYHGAPAERQTWRLIGEGEGIHWPELDEDISVRNLLEGNPSGESQRSLERWLSQRKPRA